VVEYRVATRAWEFEQIHRLNYRTFVEEIPQHGPNDARRLVDAFHAQNTYLIAARGRRVVGMLALRGERPFSIDRKLPHVDRYLPPGRRPCEIRLLATTPDVRHGFVFRGLVDLLVRHALASGYDLAVISGTVRQLKLYAHLGFVPFGHPIGRQDALYQPMYLTLEAWEARNRRFQWLASGPGAPRRPRAVPAAEGAPRREFLPGPVAMHASVITAFHAAPASCRTPEFVEAFQEVRRALCALTGARHVQILMGPGTAANDAIAAELSLERGPGLVLSNGAFGERLIDHGRRFGLEFHTLERPWGTTLGGGELEEALSTLPAVRWVWGVHGETSTGVLNDLDSWKQVTARRGIALCVDAISTIGNAPLDLGGVALASASSGKGLAAFPGLAMVFHDAPPHAPAGALPRFLDLGYYAAQEGVPFTISSNLVAALGAAVQRAGRVEHFAQLQARSTQLRRGLRAAGLEPVATDDAFHAVTTVVVPPPLDGQRVGRALEDAGFALHYRTAPLRARNWIQVCLMGEARSASDVGALLRALRRATGRDGAPPPHDGSLGSQTRTTLDEDHS
jgi:aspartate aminotransferase-like enzyme